MQLLKSFSEGKNDSRLNFDARVRLLYGENLGNFCTECTESSKKGSSVSSKHPHFLALQVVGCGQESTFYKQAIPPNLSNM